MGTHPLQQIQSLGADNLLGVVGELDVVFQDRLSQARVGLAPVGSLAEQQLVGDDAQRPPVDRGEVPSLGEHFGCCGVNDKVSIGWRRSCEARQRTHVGH